MQYNDALSLDQFDTLKRQNKVHKHHSAIAYKRLYINQLLDNVQFSYFIHIFAAAA